MSESITTPPTPPEEEIDEVLNEDLNTSSKDVRVNLGPEDVQVGTRFPTFDEAVMSMKIISH